jgi:hypothetical protein
MHLQNLKMHLIFVLIISLSLGYFLGCKSVSDEPKNSDPSLILLNLKATDENQEPVGAFKIRINNGKELSSNTGHLSVRLPAGTHSLSVTANGRLPRHFKHSIVKSNEKDSSNIQSLDVFLPSLSKVKTYQLRANTENTAGSLNEDSECGVNVTFPVGTLASDANFKMYSLTTENEKEYFINRPGGYKVIQNGQTLEASSLFTTYFQLTNANGEKASLMAPAKLQFKLLSNNQLPNLYVCSYNEETNQWESPRVATYDPESKTYSAYVDHFSWYDLLQPIEPGKIKKITVKVANFPSELVAEGTLPAASTDKRQELLALFSQYFKDMKNNAFDSDAQREERKLKLEQLAHEFALADDLEALAAEAENYSSEPQYEIKDKNSFNVASNLVSDVVVQIQSMKLGVAVRRESALTNANGEVTFNLDPEATYVYLKAVHKIGDNKGIFAQPQVMTVEEATSEGTVYINLNDYTEVTFKDGDYSYFF